MGGARRFTESRDRLINVSGSVSILPILQHKLHDRVGLDLQALTRLWALGLRKAPSFLHLHGLLNLHKANPATPGRFTSSSNIPNIRPQIGLNWFMSIFIT